MAVRPGPAGAVLAITVTDLPPPAVLADIRLPAGTRTTRDDLLVALGITPGAAVKRLPLKGGETYHGDASGEFGPAAAYMFLEAKP